MELEVTRARVMAPQTRTAGKKRKAANTAVQQDCAICLDTIQRKKTLKCSHSFCTQCIDTVFKLKPACPICNTYHGIYIGTQPEGVMTVTRSDKQLPGFEHCGSLLIEYYFPSGIQRPEHPNPGLMYTGTTRRAYLPACEEGEKVAKLLRKGFNRKLIFTVGQSATTGLDNVITWNDIHHKTSRSGGPQNFGYPDPGYLFRVQEELRLKGITEAD